jgi:hypothetical protein
MERLRSAQLVLRDLVSSSGMTPSGLGSAQKDVIG